MDGHGFDVLTKRLALLITRRRGLQVLLAGAGLAGALALDTDEAAAVCKGPRGKCKKGRDCCSLICIKPRKKKGKSGKKQKKGKCDCSFPQEGCNVAGDCCFETSTCGDNGCDAGTFCCEGEGAECVDDCDCCNNGFCEFSLNPPRCIFCSLPQETCDVPADCCLTTSTCEVSLCDGVSSCCQVQGTSCEEDCDCCGTLGCAQRQGNTCQNCGFTTDSCPPPGPGRDNFCCSIDALCDTNACGAENVCCFLGGGECIDDCDCCEDYVCQGGTCVFDLGLESVGQESLAAARAPERGKARRTRKADRRDKRERSAERKRWREREG